ncbi:hypothetical protein DPMN_030989 [Dreissena polymorpha]|uniref:Uncharacterized protein n=1 Tax=Dreissena polymorpha TaxID=45954 RepID=A0A9D4M273_DREPO|nr:hypothetical protein DPMN_030989 [Dreissena polymorpha]
MNKVDIARGKSHTEFEEIIMKGYLEAVSNNQTGIHLKLSHYNINVDNIADSHALWKINKESVQSLVIDIPICNHKTSASDKSATSIEFDLSTCHKLETLHLGGDCIRIIDLSSSDPSVILIRFPLKNIFSTKTSDALRDRIAIKNIKLTNVKCTSTLLRSLLHFHIASQPVNHAAYTRSSGCV